MSIQERAPLLKEGGYLFLFTSQTLSLVKTEGCGSSIIQPTDQRCEAKHKAGRKKRCTFNGCGHAIHTGMFACLTSKSPVGLTGMSAPYRPHCLGRLEEVYFGTVQLLHMHIYMTSSQRDHYSLLTFNYHLAAVYEQSDSTATKSVQ